MREVSDKIDQELRLTGGNGVVIEAEQASRRVVDVNFEEELIVLKGSLETALFAQNVHELENGHEQTLTPHVICNLLFQEIFLHKLHDIVTPGHFVNVNHSLN
jgi:hypothetical protein